MSFSEEIISWYTKHKRNLPWRETRDPYRIWLSEVILQQTRIEQGLPYYLKFTEAYPSVFHLARAPDEEVLKLWQGLGYYTRARNLHSTAREVADTLNGVFPQTYKELLKLKGVGDYTASAIASICFNEAAPVVDGNVYRVLARYFNIDIPINSTRGVKYFKALARELISGQDPSAYNQGIMEFGAIQCKPRSPDCSVCPLNTSCGALQKNKVGELPVKLNKRKVKKRFFNYLLITDEKCVLLQKRTKKGIWRDLYEFPLIETPAGVRREDITAHPLFKTLIQESSFKIERYNKEDIVHKLTHQHIYAKFWIITVADQIKNGIPIPELQSYPVPVLMANFINTYNFQRR